MSSERYFYGTETSLLFQPEVVDISCKVLWLEASFSTPGKTQPRSSGEFASWFNNLEFLFFFLQYVFKYIFFSIVEEQSEVVDSAAAERDFTGKLIDVLKNKEAGIKQEKFVIKTHAGEFRNLGGVDNSSFDKGDQNS